MKTLKKYIKAAKTEGKNWRKELQTFLRNYRTTPHATTGVAPSVLLMKRAVRNKIPQINNADPISEIIGKHDSTQKMKIKAYADNKSYVKPSDITLGDSVLVKRPFTRNKGMSVYNPSPMKVVKTKGTMITAKNADNIVSRNSSFFKRLSQTVPHDESDDIDNPYITEHSQQYPDQTDASVPDHTRSTQEILVDDGDPKPIDSKSPNEKDFNEDTVPEVPEASTSMPETVSEPPVLRRSTRRRIPKKMFDL